MIYFLGLHICFLFDLLLLNLDLILFSVLFLYHNFVLDFHGNGEILCLPRNIVIVVERVDTYSKLEHIHDIA